MPRLPDGRRSISGRLDSLPPRGSCLRAMVGPAPCVRPLAAIVAAISLGGVAVRAEDPPRPGKDEPWPVERQSYYYDRLLVDGDFRNATVGFTRVLRNTIYAK